MPHLAPSKEIVAAVEALKNGDLVALPTETVYGLGADAVNEDAVNIGEGTFIERLGHLVPTMENAAELRPALDVALGSWPPPGFEEIQREINGEPGRSTTHIRSAVYRLLKLNEVNSP